MYALTHFLINLNNYMVINIFIIVCYIHIVLCNIKIFLWYHRAMNMSMSVCVCVCKVRI